MTTNTNHKQTLGLFLFSQWTPVTQIFNVYMQLYGHNILIAWFCF